MWSYVGIWECLNDSIDVVKGKTYIGYILGDMLVIKDESGTLHTRNKENFKFIVEDKNIFKR